MAGKQEETLARPTWGSLPVMDTEIKHILSFPVVLISYYQLHILLSHAPLHNEGRDSAAPVHVCATNRAELT